MVKTLKFQNLAVPVPGFGCMGFSQSFGPIPPAEESLKTLKHALDIGCTFWDTAVVYGKGHNESLLGRFFKENPGAREKIFLASKCGFDCLDGGDGHVTNEASHIKAYIETTKERVGSYPDLYYLHRIDPNTTLEESITALNDLKKQGKTKYIGVSECSAATLRKACKIAHIDALQIEYSPWCTDHEHNDLLNAARELGVTIVAFSPLGRGMLTGKFKSTADFAKEGDFRSTLPKYSDENLTNNLKLVNGIEALAAKKGCTPGQLSIAWVIAQGAIPIPGTRNVTRLDENFAARDVTLTDEELAEVRKIIDSVQMTGQRYSEANQKAIGH